MANQYINTDLVSNTALAMFANNTPFVMTGSRMYEADFTNSGYKIGDTLQIRRQNHYIVGDGSTASPQDIVERVENLEVEHQYHAMISYTVKDLQLRIEDFSRLFIAPAIQEIVTRMERDIGSQARDLLYFHSGTAGTAINSFNAVDVAGTKLIEQGVDISRDAYFAMTPRDGSALKNALLNNFTDTFNNDIVRQSRIGHLSYFDVYQSQNLIAHTAGAGPRLTPGDTLLVNGAVSSGSSIVMDGATGGVTDYFVAGDVISIAGVESVNPVGRNATGQDMQFVVTANASSDGGGNITVSVSPEIISDTSSPNRNVNNAVPNNAVVTMNGSHNVNVAYPERALDIVCPPLYKLEVPHASVAVDPETGLSLAVTQLGDIVGYQNYMRLDVLCGFKWHPEYAVRVLS